MSYPEHEKMAAKRDEIDAAAEIIDWLLDNGYVLGKEHAHFDFQGDSVCYLAEPMGDRQKTDLLGKIFGIDPKKLDAEKDQMLDDIRKANA